MNKHTLSVTLCITELMRNIAAESAWRTACATHKQQPQEPIVTTDNTQLLQLRISEAKDYASQRMAAFLQASDVAENIAHDEMIHFELEFERALNAAQQANVASCLCSTIVNHVLHSLYHNDDYMRKCNKAIQALLMMLANNQA